MGPHCANEMNMFNDDPCPQWPRFMGRIDSLEDVKKLIDGYDCGVAYADQLTGQIFDKLKELGIYEDTAVIITADHGENLGELGKMCIRDRLIDSAYRIREKCDYSDFL